MHENRETSKTSVAQPGCRTAGEGSGHTARVYVSEESHSGIVPMNHSNKDGTSLAESEEGSAGRSRCDGARGCTMSAAPELSRSIHAVASAAPAVLTKKKRSAATRLTTVP